jgi:hypothetical protein
VLFHICVSVHHQSIILINQLDVTLCSLIYSLLRFTLHVSGAFCTHHQEYNQTVVTAIGTYDEEEDVGSYWMTLREGEDTLI